MEPRKKNRKNQKTFIFNITPQSIILAFLVGYAIYALISFATGSINKIVPEIPITKAIQEIKDKKIKSIEIIGNRVLLEYTGNTKKYAVSFKESGDSFLKTLRESNIDTNTVNVKIRNTDGGAWTDLLVNLIPAALTIGFFFFMFRQARGAQENIFSFGSNKAKRFNANKPKVKFADVAGVDEAKKELEEVVDFLKNPAKYQKVGARTPKGVLLVGPAGCGKTLLAKAVAGEAGVPFFSIAGSEFMEMLVGIGAARVRDLFATAKKSAPAIIFIDEIDAIGRSRSRGLMPAHDEREQTLNQILVEMDGFESNTQVLVIAATNRGDLLDAALLRPGRFDRRIMVDYPEFEGRKAILQIHAQGKQFVSELDWEKVAHRTVGYSGADLENMLNEAAIYAARAGRELVTQEDIEEAATKVKLGPEKKRLQRDQDRKLTAYHEAGHALVSHFQSETDPVHRISIVSRGQALGYTLIPPAKDKLHETKTHLMQRLAVMMGGRVAEEVVFHEVTTGAANDFSQATRIAKAMVTDYGMSALGPVAYGATYDITDGGRGGWQENTISQETLRTIDMEIQNILTHAYQTAKNIITTKRDLLDAVATKLLEKENMESEDFVAIVGAKEQFEVKEVQNS